MRLHRKKWRGSSRPFSESAWIQKNGLYLLQVQYRKQYFLSQPCEKYCRRLNAATPGDNTVMPKPVIRNIDGRTHYGCPMCDFTGKSGGVVHAHLVKVHGYKKMVCSYCKFSTGNSTSFHNHLKKYCRQLRK